MTADETDDCCVKHCDQPATYGLTMVIEGLRVELYACEPHFDILAGSTEQVGFPNE